MPPRAKPECSFCGAPATRGPFSADRETVLACDACVRLIVQLVRSGPSAAHRDIWSGVDDVEEPPQETVQSEAEAALASFKVEVAEHIRIDDAETHENLAIAYCELGMHSDAYREAAIALGADTTGTRSGDALRLLLTPPLLLPGGVRALRDRLRLRLLLH